MNDPLSILVCLPAGVDLYDPGPEDTALRDVRLTSKWESDTRGVVGWSTGGWGALRAAAAHPELPRLALLSLPYPDEMPTDFDPGDVEAKTLLIFGNADPSTGNRHGAQWQRALTDARLEMRPGAGHDILGPAWGRVLSFLAPRRKAA